MLAKTIRHPSMYLAAGSFVFAWEAAASHSLKLLKYLTKKQPRKRINMKENGIFLNESIFIGMFSFPAKIIQYAWLQSSKSVWY